jgi:hypothetical protein
MPFVQQAERCGLVGSHGWQNTDQFDADELPDRRVESQICAPVFISQGSISDAEFGDLCACIWMLTLMAGLPVTFAER